MKTSTLTKMVVAGAMSVVFAFGLTACSGSNDAAKGDGTVAATVNGTEIYEQTITDYVENVREQMGLTEDAAWGEWLVMYGYTPETIRKDVINSYVQRELISQGADEKGITVDQAKVDEYVNSMKQYYETDEEWQAALESAGMTEDYYRSEIELQLKTQALQESFATDEEPAEEDLIAQCQMYATAYDGAKKSSHILFETDDKATAQDVLDKINAGELDFAAAAQEYSVDTASATDGGNVGWDATNSFVEEYTTALEALQEGQISGLVESEYGWHIIKCTQVFTAPEEVTSSDQLPSEWVDGMKESLKSQAQSEAFNAWLEEAEASADIVINEMPEGLPYDLDLTPYQEAADAAAQAEGSSATAVDGSDMNQPAEGEEEGDDGNDAAAKDTEGEGATQQPAAQ